MMINRNRIIGSMTILLIALLSACSPAAATPDLDATVAVNVAVAQTAAVIQTQAALTIEAVQQQNPTETLTPQPTPTTEFTATPDKLMLTLSADTYCRTGTHSSFPSVALLKAGATMEVIARNPTTDSYYVVVPDQPNAKCWLWGQYATINGDQVVLPVFTSMPGPTKTPTPTPAPTFSAEFISMETCGGDFYFRFLIRNTGQVTWKAIQINVNDTTSAVSTVHSNTSFKDYSGCAAGLSQSDLTPGEDSYVATYNPGQLGYDPTGHDITASIMLCQMDSYGGCISKNVKFVP